MSALNLQVLQTEPKTIIKQGDTETPISTTVTKDNGIYKVILYQFLNIIKKIDLD